MLPVSGQADTCLVRTHHGHSSSGQPGCQCPMRFRASPSLPQAEQRRGTSMQGRPIPKQVCPFLRQQSPERAGLIGLAPVLVRFCALALPGAAGTCQPCFSKAVLLPAVPSEPAGPAKAHLPALSSSGRASPALHPLQTSQAHMRTAICTASRGRWASERTDETRAGEQPDLGRCSPRGLRRGRKANTLLRPGR